MRRPFIAVFCAVTALTLIVPVQASAKLSTDYQEWRNGPAQWLMTSEEQRAWKALTTDEEASRFIDLFWAKRDPSRGTAVNEYRAEYESRVQYSDRAFAEKKKRGALSDRGRVYILLGPATNMSDQIATSSTQMGGTGGDPTGGRVMGQRFSWIWDFEDASKFDMPKIEIVFIEDPVTRRVQRDPQRGDFSRANQVALQKAIVNPELAEVPDWAIRGGLNPRVEVIQAAPKIQVPVQSEPELEPVPAVEAPTAPVASSEPGASRLLLLKDAGVIAPSSPSDPFANLPSMNSFGRKDSIGWALQYCASHAEVPTLKYLVHISGPFEGDSKDRVTKEKEAKPTPLKAVPGCYLLRGAMPLSKFSAGSYELGVLVDEPKTGASYHPTQSFTIAD